MFKPLTLRIFCLRPNSTHCESTLRQWILTRPPSQIPSGHKGNQEGRNTACLPPMKWFYSKPSPLRNKTHHFCFFFHLQYEKVNTDWKTKEAKKKKLSTQVENCSRDETPASVKVRTEDVTESRRKKYQVIIGHWGKLLSNSYLLRSTQQRTE